MLYHYLLYSMSAVLQCLVHHPFHRWVSRKLCLSWVYDCMQLGKCILKGPHGKMLVECKGYSYGYDSYGHDSYSHDSYSDYDSYSK